MLFQFITSPEFIKPPTANTEPHKTINNRAIQLQQQISKVISSMPNQEFCRQAAINTGLPINIVDFKNTEARVQSQTNQNTLSFLLMQVKTLLREANKLKEAGHRSTMSLQRDLQNYEILHSQKMSVRVSSMDEEAQIKNQTFEDDMMKVIKNEMAFRVKMKKFNSTEKIEKKEEYLKKKAERAKDMNKRAFKIYKNHLEKKDLTQIPVNTDPVFTSPKQETQAAQVSPLSDIINKKEDQIFTSDCGPIGLRNPTQKQIKATKCKTVSEGKREPDPMVKAPVKEMGSRIKNDREVQLREKYEEVHSRQVKTRERKRRIEQQKETNAILKLIKKEQKLKELENAEKKVDNFVEKENKNEKEKKQRTIEKIHSELQLEIKAKCQEKMFKKELQLQERVNRIRQDLKQKEERMERHRFRKEREHQQDMERNQLIIRIYNTRIRDDKEEKELKHERAIRNRFETAEQRQKYWKMVENISKLPDDQLAKEMEKIRQREFFKTLKSIVFLHM